MVYSDKEFVANKIKSFRKKAKLTQMQLAEKIGITEKYLSNIETGNNLPALDSFLKIVEVLNIPLDEFGIKINTEPNKDKEQIMKIIYSATDNKLKAYLKLLNTVNEISEDLK